MKRAGAAAIKGCQQTLIQAGVKPSRISGKERQPEGASGGQQPGDLGRAQRSRPAGVSVVR